MPSPFEQVEAVSSLANIFHAAVQGATPSLYSDCFDGLQRRAPGRKKGCRDGSISPSQPSDAADYITMKKQRRH